MSDSEFTREKPNEQTYLSTLVKYLEFKGERFLASLLRNAKCTIQESSTFSKKRWNGLSTTIYFRIPVEKLALINDAVKRKLIDFCDEVMPKEIGFDVVAVEFSPLLVTAEKLDKPDTNIASENVVVSSQKEAMWDVFICHASEDKDAVARPLAHALTKRGSRVWYDEFTLRVGDSLRREIDRGLANSRYGVVILSPSFFTKNWPQEELDGLAARQDGMQKVILPIWHQVNRDDAAKFSLTLAGKFAAKTEDGLDTVTEMIWEAMEPQISLETERRWLRFHLGLLKDELEEYTRAYKSFFASEPHTDEVSNAKQLLAMEPEVGGMNLETINENILKVKEATNAIVGLSSDLSGLMEDEAVSR